LVVTRYGYGATCQRIEIIEAAHPCRMPPGLKPRGGC
jgi:hydroxypyruvate reductase